MTYQFFSQFLVDIVQTGCIIVIAAKVWKKDE